LPQLKIVLHRNAVPDRTVVVDCYVVASEPELVVHRQLDAKGEPAGSGWVVTHRRTTYTLGAPYDTRDAALSALKKISAAGLNWAFDEVGSVDMAEHKKATEAAYAARFFD